jgi:uncharacterized protein (TIGR00369 family)
MTDMEAFARNILQSQPFSRFLGVELVSCSPGKAELKLAVQDHHKQQHGFVHGGVLSYLADNGITFAGGLALGGDALTSEYKINYLRPALGTHILARAEARSTGKRQAVCVCDVIALSDEGEKLCAFAQGTVLPVSA